MDKIKLNNQIVLMRKYVKQAKVHVINKLAKQVKLLQNRKGSEAQVQKAKRKAERFLEEITLLKKTKPDDVSKLALLKAKNWEDVLKQKNCALYDRCLAMLANYGAVQKQVEIFYNENKELVLKITDLIKQWEEKNRHFHKAKKLSGANKVKLESKPRPLNKNLSTDTQTHSNADGEKNSPSKTSEELKENEQSNKRQKLIMNDKKNVSDELTKIFTEDSSKTVKLNKKSSCNEDKKRSMLEMKTSHSKDSMDNVAETIESDCDADNEEKMFIKNTSIDKRKTMVGKVQSDESEENSMDTEKSESDNEEEFGNNNFAIDNSDAESHCNNVVESKKSDSKETNTTQKYDVSEFIKKKLEMASSSERKLKAITLLNLDEMQGLTEIPVSAKNESGESDEGSSEDEANDTSHNKKSDPFFLGRGGDDDFTPEEKSDNADEDKNFKIRNKDPFFSNTRSDRGTGNFLQKQEDSNQELSHDRKYQNTGFLKKDFKRFKKDNSRSTLPIKGKFSAKNPSKYQEKWKNNFDKDNFRNRKDFNMYPKRTNDKTFEKKSNGWNSKNTESISAKNKVPYKKDNTSNKPLHPSWEAKKKQKELINTSFQGKRMVFHD